MLAVNQTPELIDNTPIGISIYSTICERTHYHEGYLEIIFCLKGSVTISVLHEEIRLEPGDLFSCDPHDIHFLFASDDKENLLVSFYFELYSPLFEAPQLPHLFFVCQKGVITREKEEKQRDLKLLLLTALYHYCFPPAAPNTVFEGLAIKVIAMMQAHFDFFDYVSNFSNAPHDHPAEAKKRFERIMVYINQHYKEKITISQLSRLEHLNANYLSHVFKATTFLGLSNYVNYIRIYNSHLQLLTTHKTISEIAYEVGFSDPKFYYKTFKEWYQHTPLQHKKYHEQFLPRLQENILLSPSEDKERIEHYIAYYFATLYL